MKRIRVYHNDRDRIILVFEPQRIRFWYKAYKQSACHWLMDRKPSRSVITYFTKHGQRLGEDSVCICLKQLYTLRDHSPQIQCVLDRLPLEITYVLGAH